MLLLLLLLSAGALSLPSISLNYVLQLKVHLNLSSKPLNLTFLNECLSRNALYAIYY